MKWFLIQSFFLALAAFGLGALFHRALWRKSTGLDSPSSGSVKGFAAAGDGQPHDDNGGAVAARVAELTALRAQHDKVVAERDARIKEYAALSFEHSAAKTALADRDESVTALRAQLDESVTASAAASSEAQGLLGRVEGHQATIAEFQNKLAAADADNDAALATLRTDYDGRIAALTSERDTAFAELRADCEAGLASRSAEHDAALVGLRAEHDRALQDAHGDRDRALSGLRSDHEKALAELRRRAESAESDLSRLAAEHEGRAAEADRLREELGAKHTEVQGLVSNLEATKLRVVDDLEAIEGIGPAMAKALNADGIRTYESLADADESRLRAAIEKAGQRFAPSIPTWSRQAAYLAAGDHDGFAAYTGYLIAGVDPAGLTAEAGNDGHSGSGEVQSLAAGAVDPGSDEAFEDDEIRADDLSRIEGIGPKISEILIAGGIRTFRRLATMPEESVRSIVNAGGVSFIPSVGTWAGQAALLRDGDEAGFQTLVDRLLAGRDEAR